jgi:transcriptional regulator with XRE-family HTH domain
LRAAGVTTDAIGAGRLAKVNAAAAERLHRAVRQAGGNLAVAERSGVPLATLNNYVRGRNGMKLKTLAALAAACAVSVEWVVSGDPPAAPGYAPEAPPPPGLSEAAQAPAPLPNTGLDVANLAKAIDILRGIAGDTAFSDRSPELARRIASIYAVLTQSPES